MFKQSILIIRTSTNKEEKNNVVNENLNKPKRIKND